MFRIIFVTQDDPFYIPYFFKHFFSNFDGNKIVIDSVVIQDTIGTGSKVALMRKTLSFYGPIGFVLKGFKYILSKLNDSKLSLIVRLLNLMTLKSICKSNNVKILNINDVNSEAFHNYVRKNNVDMIVSVSASQIFKNKTLKLPSIGCINLHNGPIPKYKGMMPNFWQMLNREEYSILSVHWMAPKLDQGKVIYRYKTMIDYNETLESLIIETKINSSKALLSVLHNKLFENQEPLEEILESSYYSFPNRKDILEFRSKGMRIW